MLLVQLELQPAKIENVTGEIESVNDKIKNIKFKYVDVREL